MTHGVVMVTQCAPYADRLAGVHGSLPQAVRAVTQMAHAHGLTVLHTDDISGLTIGELEAARLLALFTIGNTPWSAAQRAAVLRRVRAGELGVLSIHSATDACHDWPEYGALVGGRFDGHPVSERLPMTVVDGDHPATRHLGEAWSLYDEMYLFRELRPDVRVLLRIEDADATRLAPGTARPSAGYPIAWCHTEGAGRCFNTALGHYPHAWEDVSYVAHVGGGFAWALGES